MNYSYSIANIHFLLLNGVKLTYRWIEEQLKNVSLLNILYLAGIWFQTF